MLTIQQPGRTQDWIKLGGKVKCAGISPRRSDAATKTPPPRREAASCLIVTRKEEFLVLGRPGSDLLSQGLSHSTIGAEEFNGRVRDGIGFKLLARTTRPAKDKDTKQAKTQNALERSPRARPGDLDPQTRRSFVSMDCQGTWREDALRAFPRQ